jgi:hypothetical protein
VGTRKPKGINRVVKMGSGHLYPREKKLTFNDNYII